MSTMKPHEQILLEAVGAANDKDLTGKVTIGTVSDNDTEAAGDTKLLVVGVDGQATGQTHVYYDRLDVSQIASLVNLNPIVFRGDAVDKEEVVQALQSRGVNINLQDLGELVEREVGLPSFQVSSSSLLYSGDLSVSVLQPLPGQEGNQLINPETTPLVTEDHLTETTYVTGPLSSELETTQSGDDTVLRFPAGIKMGNFRTVSNGELTLSFGFSETGVGIKSEFDGDMGSIGIAYASDWQMHWSFALNDTTVSSKLVNLYDIYMTWESVDSGEKVVWKLEDGPVRQAIRMVSDPTKFVTTGVDGHRLSQNAQSMRFYMQGTSNPFFENVTPLDGNPASPGGEWVFKAEAYRRLTAGPRDLVLEAKLAIFQSSQPLPAPEDPVMQE